MNPVVVSCSNVGSFHIVVLAVYPIGQKQQSIAFIFYQKVSEFPLARIEIFLIDICTNTQAASNGLILFIDQLEKCEILTLFCPQFVIVVEVALAIIAN
jgi:hypothetical protein